MALRCFLSKPKSFCKYGIYNITYIAFHLSSFNILEPKNGDTYIYTTGMDEENLFLFCSTDDNLVQLSNLYWRREDRVGFYPNPLDLKELANILKYTNDHDMECFDIESENEIMSIKLLAQG